MAIGIFRAGKGGRFKVGSTNMRNKKWTVKDEGADLDTTNFECFTTAYGSSGSGGGRSFAQGLIGIEKATVDYSADFDVSLNPYIDPPGLFNRDDGPRIRCYQNQTDNDPWDFTVTRITNSTVEVGVEGVVTFAGTAHNQGPYTRPSQTFVV